MFITAGVQALGDDAIATVLLQVRTFNAFTPDNAPYGDDFGAFDAGPERGCCGKWIIMMPTARRARSIPKILQRQPEF